MRQAMPNMCRECGERSEAKLLKRLQARTTQSYIYSKRPACRCGPARNAFILNNNKCVRKMCNRQSQHISWWPLNRKSLSMDTYSCITFKWWTEWAAHGRFRSISSWSCASSISLEWNLSQIRKRSHVSDKYSIAIGRLGDWEEFNYGHITWIRYESIQSISTNKYNIDSLVFWHFPLFSCSTNWWCKLFLKLFFFKTMERVWVVVLVQSIYLLQIVIAFVDHSWSWLFRWINFMNKNKN